MRIVLRIRTAPEKCVVRGGWPNRRQAHVGASLLLPLALFCFFLCAWRWSFELSWTNDFLVKEGVLSHWQVWFGGGALLQIVAVWLARYAEPGPRRTPGAPTARAQEPPAA
ncbi:MAG: hypothetical protein HY236_10505 [Acidobacteria bacterium]|nr:hypothetical protein [Acidobacteriota bacterium]